jgi:hypothetical protein
MNQAGLNIFNQFGFKEQSSSGVHSIGNCPFCGEPDHFFLNTSSPNKSWDCKKCLRQGGFKTFLDQIVDYCADQFTYETAKKLIVDRGNAISFDTFKMVKMGFHKWTGKYIIPVYNIEDKLINIKLYDFHSMQNAAGCTAAMYGLWLTDFINCKDIFIPEGEWDALTFMEIIIKMPLEGIGFLAVPGAGTFKVDTLPLLQGKNIYLMYDHDDAGRKGRDKAIALLSSVAAKVFTLQWPEGTLDGFDIRDLRAKNKMHMTVEQAYNTIAENLVEVGEAVQTEDVQFSGAPVSCEDVYKVFQKHLHIPDTALLDVIFGTVLANRLPGDPLWMFIVAPPGATKTEPLLAFTGANCIEILSTLTPHTLISGTNFGAGGDPSLIPKLDKLVLIIKDFTTILTLPEQERDEIFGILRDAYDGECSKPFGNGIFRKYKSKFGIIAAVTPIIELFTEDHAALGERFLRWRNYVPKGLAARRVYIQKAIDNVGKEIEMRAELVEIAHKTIHADYTDLTPSVPDEIQDRIICLAQLVAILRGTVNREKYTKEVTFKPFIELGTRLSKQLYKLALGVGMFHQCKECGDNEYDIVVSVARCSVPHRLLEALSYVYSQGETGATTMDVVKDVGLPVSTCQMLMENLCLLGATYKKSDPVLHKIWYIVIDEVAEYIKHSRFI